MEPLVSNPTSDPNLRGLRTMNFLSLVILLIMYILVAICGYVAGIFMAIYIFSVIYAVSNILFYVLPAGQKALLLKYRVFTVYFFALLVTILSIVELILIFVSGLSFFAFAVTAIYKG